MKPRYRSETDKVRWLVLPFIGEGPGLDIGYGGDKIAPHFLSMDLPEPYANTGGDPLDIAGSVLDGIPAEDDSFETVYSSHLIEDFNLDELGRAIDEMVRVLRHRGRLILVAPDEKAYREHCAKTGQPHNFRHVHEDMGLAFLREFLDSDPKKARFYVNRVLFESSCEVDYSVVLVLEMDKVSHEGCRKDREIETLRARVADLERVVENLKAEIRGIERGIAARISRQETGQPPAFSTPGEESY